MNDGRGRSRRCPVDERTLDGRCPERHVFIDNDNSAARAAASPRMLAWTCLEGHAMPSEAEAHSPVRSRCLHPGQQQGRRWPSSSSSRVLRMRRSRVSACFASSTQQMNSLRARGVMSLQAASAVELAISASRRSSGSLCTTPPGTRLLVTEKSRSARATGGQAVRSPTVARLGRASRQHPLLPPQVRRYLSACSDDPVPWRRRVAYFSALVTSLCTSSLRMGAAREPRRRAGLPREAAGAATTGPGTRQAGPA